MIGYAAGQVGVVVFVAPLDIFKLGWTPFQLFFTGRWAIISSRVCCVVVQNQETELKLI